MRIMLTKIHAQLVTYNGTILVLSKYFLMNLTQKLIQNSKYKRHR